MWGYLTKDGAMTGSFRILVAALFGGFLFSGLLGAQSALGDDQLAEGTSISTPYFACFDAALALRIGQAVTERGTLRPWAKERFKSGSCLALAPGTKLSHITAIRVSGRWVERFRLFGSQQFLIRPDWAIDPEHHATRRAFEAMVPVTTALFDFGDKHIACLQEVTDLNARVTRHNRAYAEMRDAGQDEAVSMTIITFNGDDIAKQGAKLNREVQDFRKRCQAYSTLEASIHFVDLVRERAGLEPAPQPSAA